MDHQTFAKSVREASKKAVLEYLKMCELDSPWEVPEIYMAVRSAKALSSHFRVAVEFKLGHATNIPFERVAADLKEWPTRFNRDSRLDIAILGREGNR